MAGWRDRAARERRLHSTLDRRLALVLYIQTASVQWRALGGESLVAATTLNPPSFTLPDTVGSNNLMLRLKFKEELHLLYMRHIKHQKPEFKQQILFSVFTGHLILGNFG